MEENDFVCFTLKQTPLTENEDTAQQWRIVSKLKLHYSEANGNEPDTIFILQPVLSGFEISQPDSPKAFAVLEEEFDEILAAVEG
jgi:hypothetical protein